MYISNRLFLHCKDEKILNLLSLEPRGSSLAELLLTVGTSLIIVITGDKVTLEERR